HPPRSMLALATDEIEQALECGIEFGSVAGVRIVVLMKRRHADDVVLADSRGGGVIADPRASTRTSGAPGIVVLQFDEPRGSTGKRTGFDLDDLARVHFHRISDLHRPSVCIRPTRLPAEMTGCGVAVCEQHGIVPALTVGSAAHEPPLRAEASVSVLSRVTAIFILEREVEIRIILSRLFVLYAMRGRQNHARRDELRRAVIISVRFLVE